MQIAETEHSQGRETARVGRNGPNRNKSEFRAKRLLSAIGHGKETKQRVKNIIGSAARRRKKDERMSEGMKNYWVTVTK